MFTPWGYADYATKCRDGVYSVSTPGHGGILVDKAVARKELSPQAQAIGESFRSWLAYEEDCDWAAVTYEHPEWVISEYRYTTVDQLKARAKECLALYHPSYFAPPEEPVITPSLFTSLFSKEQ